MAKHNPTDDAVARTLVENQITDIVAASGVDLTQDNARTIARAVVGAFEFVQMDTTRANVAGGHKVNLRRPVLTGHFEVDSNAQAKD